MSREGNVAMVEAYLRGLSSKDISRCLSRRMYL